MATAADCGHDWCVAPHEPMCDCPFSNAQPHVAAGCRYAPTDPPAGTTKRAFVRPDGDQERAR